MRRMRLDPLYKALAREEWIVYPTMQETARYVELRSIVDHSFVVQVYRVESNRYQLHITTPAKRHLSVLLTLTAREFVPFIHQLLMLLDPRKD